MNIYVCTGTAGSDPEQLCVLIPIPIPIPMLVPMLGSPRLARVKPNNSSVLTQQSQPRNQHASPEKLSEPEQLFDLGGKSSLEAPPMVKPRSQHVQDTRSYRDLLDFCGIARFIVRCDVDHAVLSTIHELL